MPHASSIETQEQILNVAECLLAENGYAGTTLRNVVSKANVNLAAVHYHFGSKEDLLKAVIARISGPVVSGQLAALAALIEKDVPLSVAAILRAYLEPALTCAMGCREAHPLRGQFIGRSRTEPEPMQSIAAEQFQPSTEKFLDALQQALPDQTRSQLNWKLDLVVACLIRSLFKAGQPNAVLSTHTPDGLEQAITKLIAFLTPGLESD
ncbi:MAG: TetR/AcrR family transcriptional regulator [Cyanobacteria bacterium P01_D01_bin.1]